MDYIYIYITYIYYIYTTLKKKKVKKKDIRASLNNCIIMSIEVVLVSFVVDFGHISYHSLVFLLFNFEQVNTNWEYDSSTITWH